jgi:hypothetical protein
MPGLLVVQLIRELMFASNHPVRLASHRDNEMPSPLMCKGNQGDDGKSTRIPVCLSIFRGFSSREGFPAGLNWPGGDVDKSGGLVMSSEPRVLEV